MPIITMPKRQPAPTAGWGPQETTRPRGECVAWGQNAMFAALYGAGENMRHFAISAEEMNQALAGLHRVLNRTIVVNSANANEVTV